MIAAPLCCTRSSKLVCISKSFHTSVKGEVVANDSGLLIGNSTDDLSTFFKLLNVFAYF